MSSATQVISALDLARERTLALVEDFDDATLQRGRR